jgi:hypothetical protein
MKAALFDVVSLQEMGRQYEADTKIALAVATLQVGGQEGEGVRGGGRAHAGVA